jgi:stage III sporulation protein AE
MKAAKFTISGVVPVIGGILSDATEAILAGAGILKTRWDFRLVTVLSICAAPFLELGVHYLVYKLSSALASTVADGPTADLIGEIGDAFGLILGMTGACALLLLVSIVRRYR